MASNSVLQAVQHYQRSIEKSSGDVARLLHCVGKLYKLPITVEHLQETGVGRTVNELRIHNGELGVAAEAVVNKWKELVTSENDRQANNQSPEQNSTDDEPDEENDDHKSIEETPNETSTRRTTSKEYSHKHEKSTHKGTREDSPKNRTHKTHDRHEKESRDSKKHRSRSKDKHSKERESKKHKLDAKHGSSSSKEKHDKDKHSKHKRERDEEKNKVISDSTVEMEKMKKKQEHREKHNSTQIYKEKHKRKDEVRIHSHSSSGKDKSHHKSSKDKDTEQTRSKSQTHSSSKKSTITSNNTNDQKPSTSVADTTNLNSSTERKRRHDDNSETTKSPKKSKGSTNIESKHNSENANKCEVPADDDGIDSSMGANFADVLGMLNMPQKKAKKSISALKQASPNSPKKSVENSTKKISSPKKLNGMIEYDGPSTSSSTSSSQRNFEKKPDLLASNAKLAPLDPSIVLDLPIISNNYKPLPLNPTVMDCVFNSSTSSSSRAPPRLFTDAEALSHGISSKTIRTKIYSGIKSGQLFQAPSLFDLCIRVLQKNIDALEYTGGVPFDVLRPVLERASPQQLFVFEEYNPYVMEDSDVLWQQHVQRTYRGQKREEMETWREMFMRCQDEQERRLSMLAKNIKQSQKIMAEPVRKTQLAFVDTLVKPPRGVMRKQEQYGTKSKLVATPASRVAALSNVTPNAAKTGDARLKAAASIKFDPAQVASAPMRPKKAPLMAKTLQFIRGRQRR